MNFVVAVVIGVVIGAIAGFAVKNKQANAIWLAPVAAVVGAVLASILATLLGDPIDYGWKEKSLQVVLAVVGAGAVALMASRKAGGSAESTA